MTNSKPQTKRLTAACFGLFLLSLWPDSPIRSVGVWGWIPAFIIFYTIPRFWERLKVLGLLYLSLVVIAISWTLFVNEALFLPALSLSIWLWPGYFVILGLVNRFIRPPPVFQPWIAGALWLGIDFWLNVAPANLVSQTILFPFPNSGLQLLKWFPQPALNGFWGFFCSTAALFWLNRKSKPLQFTLGAQIFLIICILIHGSLGLKKASSTDLWLSTKKIVVIQHNFEYLNRDKVQFSDFSNLAFQAALKKPNLIVFPLYSLSKELERELTHENGAFRRLAQEIQIPILIASRWYDPLLMSGFFERQFGPFWVAAFLFEKDGSRHIYKSTDRSALHDKLQVLEPSYKVISSSLGKLGVLLCYDSINPKWVKEAKAQGAEVLISLSNPADSPYSLLPYQSLRFNQIRAIQAGLPMIHATANGFSAFIDSHGRISKRSQRNKTEILINQ